MPVAASSEGRRQRRNEYSNDPDKTFALLENSKWYRSRFKVAAKASGYGVLEADDPKAVENLAVTGVRLFVVDIRLDERERKGKETKREGERRKHGGILALQKLRRKAGERVFVAVWSAFLDSHRTVLRKLRPDITVQKEGDTSAEFATILKASEEWKVARELGRPGGEDEPIGGADERDLRSWEDAGALFPSDELAVEITGATEDEMAELVQERRAIAEILGENLPTRAEIEREIGDRMRFQLRGVLASLGEEARERGQDHLELGKQHQFSHSMVRRLYKALPVGYGADPILDELFTELEVATGGGWEGSWGRVWIEGNRILLSTVGEQSANRTRL